MDWIWASVGWLTRSDSSCFKVGFFLNKEYIYSYSKQTVVNSIYEGVIKYTTDISGKCLYDSASWHFHNNHYSNFCPLKISLWNCDVVFVALSAALLATSLLKNTFFNAADTLRIYKSHLSKNGLQRVPCDIDVLSGSKWLDIIRERYVWQIIAQQAMYKSCVALKISTPN